MAWSDKDFRLVHLVFGLLGEFLYDEIPAMEALSRWEDAKLRYLPRKWTENLRQELSAKYLVGVLTDPDMPMEYQQAVVELYDLYAWYRSVYCVKEEAGEDLLDNAIYEETTNKLARVVHLRHYLWT